MPVCQCIIIKFKFSYKNSGIKITDKEVSHTCLVFAGLGDLLLACLACDAVVVVVMEAAAKVDAALTAAAPEIQITQSTH